MDDEEIAKFKARVKYWKEGNTDEINELKEYESNQIDNEEFDLRNVEAQTKQTV